MEDYIKRVNLSFDLRRERDRKAYEVIASKQHKTTYVINLVLSPDTVSNNIINKKDLRECLKEVLNEMNIYNKKETEVEEDKIPKEVFDIFEQI